MLNVDGDDDDRYVGFTQTKKTGANVPYFPSPLYITQDLYFMWPMFQPHPHIVLELFIPFIIIFIVGAKHEKKR